jgi:hypothetical protein
MNILTLVVGNPSTGKTTSGRNFGPETFIINVERKALPFRLKGAHDYWLGYRPATPESKGRPAIPAMSSKDHMFFILEQLKASTKFKYVLIDSFSSFTDQILADCKLKFKGFDVWNNYNTIIYDFFQKLKELENKFVFVIAHIEYLSDADGNMVTRTKAKGKEWEGAVEKEVTCVLYSRAQRKEVGNGCDYQFVTNSDGYLPGKTPMEMFDIDTELYVPNDLAEVVERYKKYYSLDENLQQIKAESLV